MRFRLPLLLHAAPVAACAFGWNATGHMVVGAIAYERLTPAAKAEVDRLIPIGAEPKSNDFMTATVWADDYRGEGHSETGPWHYINYHFRDDGKETANKPEAENVETALAKFSDILKDKSKPDADRAQALRYVLHFVGDSHQPLHATARDSDAHPSGDRGGNDFAIVAPPNITPAPRTLHFLWDGGGGLFNGTVRPLSARGVEKIAKLAKTLLAKYGAEEEPAAADLTFSDWTHESFKLAQTQVYNLKEGEVPSEDYLAAAQATSGKRIVLAGFRLANLLNKLLA